MIVALAAFACVAAVAGQETGNKPVGPYAAIGAEDSSSKPNQVDAAQLSPDSNAVTGVQLLTLGHARQVHSLLQPSFSFSQAVDTNPAAITASGRDYVSYFTGDLSLQRRHAQDSFVLDYNGGATLYQHNTGYNSSFHRLNAMQAFSLRRWQLTFANRFEFTPESRFGFAGFAATGETLRPELLPNQSFLDGHNERWTNTAATDVEYRLSARSSATASFSFGMLRYLDDALRTRATNQWSASAGFDHQFGSRNTLAMQYSHARFDYRAQVFNVETDSASLVFARRVTGRLSFELRGGPQIIRMGGLWSLGPAAASLDPTALSYTAGGSVLYQRGHYDISLSGSRFTSGGAGGMQGAHTTTAQGAIARTLGRSWRADVAGGYTRNERLGRFAPDQMIASLYGSVRLSRDLTRSVGTFVNYNVQHQDAVTGCSSVFCSNQLRHIVTIGIDWRPRPLSLE